MPKLNSDLLDYFTIQEGTKVKIKNIQYSAIGLHRLFVLKKRYFLHAEHGRLQRDCK